MRFILPKDMKARKKKREREREKNENQGKQYISTFYFGMHKLRSLNGRNFSLIIIKETPK